MLQTGTKRQESEARCETAVTGALYTSLHPQFLLGENVETALSCHLLFVNYRLVPEL